MAISTPVSSQLSGLSVSEPTELYGDIDSLIAYVRMRPSHTPTVLYAVDFAELYAYVYPDYASGDMGIFSDDTDEEKREIQLCVNNLLFNLPNKLVLLEPYEAELAGFRDRVFRGELQGVLTAAAEALREVQEIVQHEGFQRVSALATAMSDRDVIPRAGDEDVDEVLTFFQNEGAQLLVLVERTSPVVRARLARLLTPGTFVDLASYVKGDVDVDAKLVDSLDQRFEKRRGRARGLSSYLDAWALSMVHAANMHLRRDNTQIYLISRSKDMRWVVSKEVDEGRWESRQEHVLVHPRSLSALNGVGGGEADLPYLESLRVLLASLGTTRKARRTGSDDDVEIDVALHQVKQQWYERARLSSSIVVGSGESGVQVSEEDKVLDADGAVETALMLYRLVTNPEHLRNLIHQRIASLADELSREYKYLAFAVPVRGEEKERVNDRLVIRRPVYVMPYRLNFASQSLQEWSDLVRIGEEIPVEQLLDLVRSGFKAGEDFETLLLVAYIFGAWSRWELAELYCGLALSQRSDHDISVGEAELFMATCLRKRKKVGAEHYARALDLLDRAEQSMGMTSDAPTELDPRLLKERAAIIFEWNTSLPEDTDAVSSQPPPVEDALKISGDALALARNDHELAAHILNNLCFFYLQSRTEEANEKAADYCTQLIEAQQQAENDPERWPVLVLDTVAWAHWRLGERLGGEKALKQWVDHLQHALDTRRLASRDKTLVKAHLKEIRGVR